MWFVSEKSGGPNLSASIALIHSPVLNKKGELVTTNVTNFDIHDVARCARTYGVKNYFIVNNTREQLMYVERVLSHWRSGEGSNLNPKRVMALSLIKTAETIKKVIDEVTQAEGQKPYVVATAARPIEGVDVISFSDLKASERLNKPLLVLFGTGFGLPEEFVKTHCDALLEPISGASQDGYNHLSVRSAISICLDRILG